MAGIAESAKAGYNSTQPETLPEAVGAAETAEAEPAEPPPAYQDVVGLPDWCTIQVFEEAFTTKISTPEQLLEVCTNLVQKFDLNCTSQDIESACEQYPITEQPFEQAE